MPRKKNRFFCELKVDKDFLERSQKAQAIKTKLGKLDFIKILNLGSSKDIVKEMNRLTHMSDRRLASRV